MNNNDSHLFLPQGDIWHRFISPAGELAARIIYNNEHWHLRQARLHPTRKGWLQVIYVRTGAYKVRARKPRSR